MGERSLRLFDAHCHLQSPRLAPHLDAALAAAVEAGVVACAVNATCEADWQDVLDLAARQSTPALRHTSATVVVPERSSVHMRRTSGNRSGSGMTLPAPLKPGLSRTFM